MRAGKPDAPEVFPRKSSRYAQAMPTSPTPGRWFDAPTRTIPTLNRGSKVFATSLPQLVVVHYTAGRSATNTIKRFLDPASRVSAHFVIAESGGTTQMVDCQRKAWHAGESKIALPDGTLLRGINDHSIGIELDYDGYLATHDAGRRPRTSSDVITVHDRLWPLYDTRQIGALIDVVNELRRRDWVSSPCYLVGHEDIAPGRKLDPGPAFPWAEVCERTQLSRILAP